MCVSWLNLSVKLSTFPERNNYDIDILHNFYIISTGRWHIIGNSGFYDYTLKQSGTECRGTNGFRCWQFLL